MRHLLAALLLAAACGAERIDEMPLPKPAACWPIQIQAGVNDKIDFTNASGTYAATIAAATYYTPAALAEAVRAALQAAYASTGAIQIQAGVNDKLDMGYWVGFEDQRTATIAAGSYTEASLEAALEAALEAMDAGPAWAYVDGAGWIQITSGGAQTWRPNYAGANAATSAWGTLGFTQAKSLSALQQSDSDPFGAAAWAVTVSSTGRVTVSNAGGLPFSLLFSTGANAATSARDVLGFGAVDTASAQSATGGLQIQNAWFAPDPVVDDTGNLPQHDRAQTVSLAGVVKSLHYGTRNVRRIALAFLPASKVFLAEEGSATNEAIERLYRDGWTRFRWFPDATDLATGSDYALDIESAKALPRNRLSPGAALYSLELRMRPIV